MKWSSVRFVGVFVAVAAWLLSTSAISKRDIAFAVAFPAWAWLANTLRFRGNAADAKESLRGRRAHHSLLLTTPHPRWFKPYMQCYALMSWMAPFATLLYCRAGFAGLSMQNVDAVFSAAGPCVFLLIAQILMEWASGQKQADGTCAWASLIRIVIPIGFNAYRMLPLGEWVEVAVALASVQRSTFTAWFAFLAVCNFLMWAYNLFVFLLLQALPQYLDAARFAT